ncbi:MAG: hypothetical protein Q7K29_04520 [Thermoleophilia bacterium]|nr:hypothetical protein [Thermoleophilia bacterium]
MKYLAISAVALSLSMPAAGCGDSGTGDEGFPVPDIQGQKQKARDASDKAEQKQKEIEDNLRQMEEGP